ncbi:hypothetical protein Y1Q_0012842 [Alligator mississippiensis]|uniref:Uncharacterized protein n=1 Tax=Alligator mississippiensis TaxID=8496 RepID=A0A151P492_ALLMI|nr:hypothetical protein Y1Q_0012842 [Alligator mississippiensis]
MTSVLRDPFEKPRSCAKTEEQKHVSQCLLVVCFAKQMLQSTINLPIKWNGKTFFPPIFVFPLLKVLISLSSNSVDNSSRTVLALYNPSSLSPD